jgi:Icc-related predicted phosphoesterase
MGMRILAISDLHGSLSEARRACERFQPELLLCCGDWGDPDEISEVDLNEFLAYCPVLTTFGNHDPLDLLTRWRNLDGSSVLLGQGEVRAVQKLRVAAIGGIWAKSHRLPWYVTDEDISRLAKLIAAHGPVEILLTHACPVGLADLTPSGRHGGQRAFLDAFQTVAPRVQLCGHVHVAQERSLKDGRKVINIGATPAGSIAVLDFDPAQNMLTCRLIDTNDSDAM